MSPARWLTEWPKYEAKIKVRLQRGFEQYGDHSFDRPLTSLLREVEEEIYDQILWSFIGLTRLGDLRKRAEQLEDQITDAERSRLDSSE